MASQIPTLSSLCVDAIIKNKKYKTTMGCLELYSILSNHFINPKFEKIRLHCVNIVRDVYPMLLSKYGYEELSKVIEREDLEKFQKQYDEEMYIKHRFEALKGTIIEPTAYTVTDDNVKSGYYPLAALIQGAAWPAGVDPIRREDYLSPEDFQSVFHMSKGDFRALDKHWRIRLKKEHHLF